MHDVLFVDVLLFTTHVAPCALILCPTGHTCEVQGTTAYCEPSCEPSSNLCEEGEICELMDQDCDGHVPCPHTYQCLSQETCK